MKLSIPGALALSLLVAACGGSQPAQDSPSAAGTDVAADGADAAQTAYSATGNVTAITDDRVTISHGPVEGLGWPAMTMTFQAGAPTMLQGTSVGDHVAFQFRKSGADYRLTAINRAP